MTAVDFILNGVSMRLTSDEVRTALRGHLPDPVQVHWVEVDGVRWPPRQVFSLAARVDRRDFISHTALRHLNRLGFITSDWTVTGRAGAKPPIPGTTTPGDTDGAAAAFSRVVDFLAGEQLTSRISSVESAVQEAGREGVEGAAAEAGLDGDLLAAALLVRKHAGRLNDVIHAATILSLIPKIMEPTERMVNRPSLGAGNDPGRPFDLETNLRIAEVKVSVWTGADAMRMRTVFADVVNLVLPTTDRRRQLFVVGPRPGHWLRGGASVAWALGRSSPNLREAFTRRFGSSDTTVGEFMAGPGAGIEVLDLRDWVPELRDPA